MSRPLVLFRFFRYFDSARERVRIIRRLNPGVPIAALFGGHTDDEREARQQLGGLVDDFAVAPPAPARWKWLHSDLMIDRWFRDRGHALPFDVLFDHEADLLCAAPFASLQPRADSRTAAFTGLELLERVPSWGWIAAPEHREPFARFSAYLKDVFGRAPRCAGKIPSVLGRALLEAMTRVELPPELIAPIVCEISHPALAEALGFTLSDTGYQRPWGTPEGEAADRHLLNHDRFPIAVRTIARELQAPRGQRVFHPVDAQIMIEDLEQFTERR